MDEQQYANLNTWAIVEMFGHQKIAGLLRTENMGAAVLLRVDVPEVPQSTDKYLTYEYDAEGKYQQIQKERVRPALQAMTKYLGVGAIYAITPCSEEVARQMVAELRIAPPVHLQMPAPALLQAAATPDEDDEDYEGDEVGVDFEDRVVGGSGPV